MGWQGQSCPHHGGSWWQVFLLGPEYLGLSPPPLVLSSFLEPQAKQLSLLGSNFPRRGGSYSTFMGPKGVLLSLTLYVPSLINWSLRENGHGVK